jgi:hypothetical protein
MEARKWRKEGYVRNPWSAVVSPPRPRAGACKLREQIRRRDLLKLDLVIAITTHDAFAAQPGTVVIWRAERQARRELCRKSSEDAPNTTQVRSPDSGRDREEEGTHPF